MLDLDRNERIRLAALAHVATLRQRWDDHVPAGEIEKGFPFDGERVLLVGPGMGIFKPKQLGDGPITIRSSLASSYRDEPIESGAGIEYEFAPPAREYDNVGLARLVDLRRPLIYLIQVAPRSHGSEYAIVAPVFVTGRDDAKRRFAIALSPPQGAWSTDQVADRISVDRVEPAYRMVELKARLHQAHFRKLVLRAYRQRCAVCALRVRPLLDAAHIVPDRERGPASVQNGLGLCVLHHRAFDRGILQVRPDYTVGIRADAIDRGDDFAARGLGIFAGRTILLPARREQWPSREALERAFVG